jgi:HD-GYP domain-containing protein (c-di-GMP phosphodiesterase class II)
MTLDLRAALCYAGATFLRKIDVEASMDTPLQLCYPITTLDEQELLPGGAYLSAETMSDLVRSAQGHDFPSGKLMEYETVAADLQRICDGPPYNRMFSDPGCREEIFLTLQGVELPRPLLEIYSHFKTHDPYTYSHILTVFALSLLLAREMVADRTERALEVAAATSHDFGKICVPLSILKKTTPLEEWEKQRLSHHAAAGYVLLSYYLKDWRHPAAITARDHHERIDGSGYPGGIVQRRRFVEIVAVGDMFDALVSCRPYRQRSFDLRTALEELTRQAERGTISEDVVRVLVSCNREGHPPFETCSLSHELRGKPPADNHYCGITPCRFEPKCPLEDERGAD